jgi:hypothetical protein
LSDRQKSLASLLRRLATLVEQSSHRDLDALVRGDKELRLIMTSDNGKPVRGARHAVWSQEGFATISARLAGLETREAGRELLDEALPTKASLERFARFLDLPLQRTNTIESLREKIIEAAIGSRLRSEAVQGRKS